VEKGNLADSDGSKDSSLESNEFRSYGRNDGTFLKEVKRDADCVTILLLFAVTLCVFFRNPTTFPIPARILTCLYPPLSYLLATL
jgi:hypothetical protein